MADIKEYCKTAETINKESANYSKAMTTLLISVVNKLEVKDYIIQKVEKRKYVVCVELPTGKTTIEKTFKSITAANEWCAIHLKKI